MSELLQSGHHPDADQLSAFIEQALPMHEREQMLAHLAVCPECRETVALSLPDTDESPQIRIVYVRRPWFTSWNLLWPVTATACTAMAIFGFYIHNAATVRNESTSTTQMAESQRPSLRAPAGHPATALKPPVQQSQSLPARQIEDFKNEPKSTDALKAKEETREKDIASLSAANRNILMSEKSLAAAPTQEPAATQLQSPQETGAARGLSVTGANAAKLAPLMNQAKAAPPAPAALQPATAGMIVSGGALATVAAQQANILLPSGLPVLSMATHEKQILAIDSRNAVYLSQDSGQHWATIRARWKSRPVSATLVAYGAPRSSGMGSTENGTVAALANNELPAAATSGPSLAGTVTDMSGAAIAGASLEMSDCAGNVVRTVTTNTDGRYLIDGVAPGTYRIRAEARGFLSQVLAAVPVSANQQNVTNISLTVGAVSETVTVDAESVSTDEMQTTRKQKKKPADKQSTPVFEILTDNGDHWTSPDGVTWKHR